LRQPLRHRIVADLLARGTQPAHEPLSHDAAQSGRDLVRLHPHVEKAGDRVGGIIGVQRGENQVPGERRLNRYLRRLLIADFADEDDVGVLA